MTRRLLILAAIAALFTIVTVVPASAIAVNTGQGAQTVLDPDTEDGPNNAHGPACGAIPGGCVNNEGSTAAADNTFDVPGLTEKTTPLGTGQTNLGAWNAFFESNDNSAICGITTTSPPTNTCEVLP